MSYEDLKALLPSYKTFSLDEVKEGKYESKRIKHYSDKNISSVESYMLNNAKDESRQELASGAETTSRPVDLSRADNVVKTNTASPYQNLKGKAKSVGAPSNLTAPEHDQALTPSEQAASKSTKSVSKIKPLPNPFTSVSAQEQERTVRQGFPVGNGGKVNWEAVIVAKRKAEKAEFNLQKEALRLKEEQDSHAKPQLQAKARKSEDSDYASSKSNNKSARSNSNKQAAPQENSNPFARAGAVKSGTKLPRELDESIAPWEDIDSDADDQETPSTTKQRSAVAPKMAKSNAYDNQDNDSDDMPFAEDLIAKQSDDMPFAEDLITAQSDDMPFAEDVIDTYSDDDLPLADDVLTGSADDELEDSNEDDYAPWEEPKVSAKMVAKKKAVNVFQKSQDQRPQGNTDDSYERLHQSLDNYAKRGFVISEAPKEQENKPYSIDDNDELREQAEYEAIEHQKRSQAGLQRLSELEKLDIGNNAPIDDRAVKQAPRSTGLNFKASSYGAKAQAKPQVKTQDFGSVGSSYIEENRRDQLFFERIQELVAPVGVNVLTVDDKPNQKLCFMENQYGDDFKLSVFFKNNFEVSFIQCSSDLEEAKECYKLLHNVIGSRIDDLRRLSDEELQDLMLSRQQNSHSLLRRNKDLELVSAEVAQKVVRNNKITAKGQAAAGMGRLIKFDERIKSILMPLGFIVSEIVDKNYQKQIELISPNKTKLKLLVYYKGNNLISSVKFNKIDPQDELRCNKAQEQLEAKLLKTPLDILENKSARKR